MARGKEDGGNLYVTLGALGLALAVKGGFFFYYQYSLLRQKSQDQKVPYSVARPALKYTPGAKKVLVTGGCGFLGRHIVSQLLEKFGNEINVYVFDACPPPPVTDDRVTYIRGDLTSYTHVEMAITKSAVVIHAGALVHLANVPAAKVADVIELGTKNVVDACLEKEVPALVYTSSAIVTLPNDRLLTEPVTEADIVSEESAIGQYAVSKLRAEKLVLHVDCHVLHTVALRPGGIYGHGDRILVDGLLKGQPFVGPGIHQVPMVWVEDAARAHVIACEKLLRFQALKAKSLGPLFGSKAPARDSSDPAEEKVKEGEKEAQEKVKEGLTSKTTDEFVKTMSSAAGLENLTPEEREEVHFMKANVFGKAFLITNDAVRDPLIYREFMGGIPIPEPADLPPLNPWDRPYANSTPAWLIKKLAAVNTMSYDWTGYCPLPPALTPDTMVVASRPWPCCADAALKALGWTTTPWREVSRLLVRQKRERDGADAAAVTAEVSVSSGNKKDQ